MRIKVITALSDNSIAKEISKNINEVVEDIPYQDGVLEIIKKNFVDMIVLSEDLEGEYDKYIFIDKIRQIDSKIKIIMIVFNEDENYKKFLYSKGIFDIFTDKKSTVEELIVCIINEYSSNPYKSDLKQKNTLKIKEVVKDDKNALKVNMIPKFQKQQVIAFTGSSGVGKTTLAIKTALLLAKYNNAKVLLIDLDIENASVSYHLGIDRVPKDIEYVLPPEKNSSLNYMIEAIDKKNFNANIFEKYLVKSKLFSNLDILTGNKSLYVSKNILNFEYYTKILENAKLLYDFIIIDSSSNVFLDAMQYSLINAGKIFFVTEGNYIALERAHRLLSDIFPAWGVSESKINILINKYNKKSLNKIVIKDMLKERCVSGYISFSDKYEENINSINPSLSKEIENEFYSVLENFELVPKRAKLRRISDKIEGFKLKIQKKEAKNDN